MESGQFVVLPSCLFGSLLPFVLPKEKASETLSRSDKCRDLKWNLWFPSWGEVTQSDISWVCVTMSTKMQGVLPWFFFGHLSVRSVGGGSLVSCMVCTIIQKPSPSMACVSCPFQWVVLNAYMGKLLVVTGGMASAWSVLTHILKFSLVWASLEAWCFGFQGSIFVIVWGTCGKDLVLWED